MTSSIQTELPSELERKHSGMGMASFVLSIVAGVAIFALFTVAGMMEASTPGGMDERDPEVVLLGLGIIAAILADLVALGLGVAGLCQPDRKKVFAVLGTVFSAVMVAGAIALVALGLWIQASEAAALGLE